MTNQVNQQELDPLLLERQIWSTRSFLRSRGVGYYDAVDAVAQIFAWVRISLEKGLLPQEWNIFHERDRWHEQRLQELERFFANSDNGLWNTAFDDLARRLKTIGASNFEEIVSSINAVMVKGSVNWTELAVSLVDDDFNQAMPQVTKEIADLAHKLLQIKVDETVYSSFPPSFELALRTAANGNSVHFETATRSTLIACLVVIANLKLEVTFADPISQPSYVEAGRLKGFDVGLAATNFGLKRSLPSHDVFGRFGAKGFYSEITDVKHVLAHTKRRAILVVPNSVLFRTSSGEKDFKEQIVQAGWLKAVIALPEGLLSNSNIQISLLVFDKETPSNDVLFVNGASEFFTESRKGSKGSRNKLINIDALADAFDTRQDSATSKVVSHSECEAQGYDLMVSKYVLNAEQKKVHQLLSSSETTTLGDLAEIIRGQAVKPGSDDIQYCFGEVGAVDIGDDGLICEPQKKVFVDQKDMLSNNVTNLVLQPGDLVLAVKGSVGIVGMFAPSNQQRNETLVPLVRMADMELMDKLDDGGGGSCGGMLLSSHWIVGQSYVIIRPYPTGYKQRAIKSEVLLMYLRSEIAQNWMKSKSSGSTVPLLQKQYINGLPVIVPNESQQKIVSDRFNQIVNIENEVRVLKERSSELFREPWPIP